MRTRLGKTIFKKDKRYAIATGKGNSRGLYGAGGRSYTFRTKSDARGSLKASPSKLNNPRVVKVLKTKEGDVNYRGRWRR